MAGLLDFLSSPGGIGLLSGVASYAANARRGVPINNLGRGLAGGLVGYQQANDQTDANAAEKQQRELRDLQIQQARQSMEALTKQNAWRAGLPAAMEKAKGNEAPFQADNPFDENLGVLKTGQPADPNAMRDYMTQPDSPYLDEVFKEQIKGTDPADKFGKVMPHAYTPERLAAYSQSGNYADLKPIGGGQGDFGKVNPGQFTPESLSRYAETGVYGDLVPFRSPVQIDQGDRKTLFDPGRRTNTSYEVAPGPESLPSFKAAQTVATESAKAGVEKTVNQPKAAARVSAADAKTANLLKAIELAKEQTGYSSAGPIGQITSGIGGTPAKNLSATLNTIKANLGFDELQEMRDNSPTGGALGQVAVQEINYLQSVLASLEQSQGPQQLRDNLDKVAAAKKASNERIKQAYAQTYPSNVPSELATPDEASTIRKMRAQGATDAQIAAELNRKTAKPAAPRAAGTFREPIRVSNEADYNSVPKGKYYQAPDGSIRVRK